jgi:hypothetical protein
MRPIGKVAMGAAAVTLLAGTAACSGSGSGGGAFGADGAGGPGHAGAVEALTAAAETTSEITSADFDAVTRLPAAGGDIEMTGSMSWGERPAMDVTMTGGRLGFVPGAPDEVSLVWLDGVMYTHMGPEFGALFGGRDWMRMDLMSIAEETGDEAVTDAMSYGLDQANQDPAQQVALLLESPDVERAGQEQIDGATVDHYQGTISAEDALSAEGEDGAGLLGEEQRRRITEAMREQGIDGYDIDVWLDENDFPVRIRQSYETDEGPVESEVNYRGLGTDVEVAAPPAGSVIDFMDLLDEMASGMGPGM